MANSILISDYQRKAFNVLGLGLSFMLLMIQKGYARDFSVNWGLHNGTNAENYNQWAEKNRFQIGDSLVFTYTPNDDSVLQVNEDAYKNCSVESPLSSYTDGHTVFSLSHSGPYYFISGNKDNCEKNEKLVVVVLADRSNRSSTANETNPSSPPPSSSIDIMPSQAPSGESPPAGTVENPTPAPSDESKPPNAASAVFMSVTASMGAVFAASTLLLGF
ncbi:early nodulin-like protein 3 [Gossypium australe]|uniref:Early nodulin-like protein 3 n=1 Tax=Gossypium australe TaxID=47621 RepID=A0A5B6X145_9ROSI|nr:early nodulin-like protein 3 [Gossypium australe]